MKIDPNLQPIGNLQSDAVQNAKTSRAQESTSEDRTAQLDGSDTVQVSSQFAQVQQLTSRLQQLPDIRTDRVAALRERIHQGTYNPDPAAVASALLNDPLSHAAKS